MKIFNFKKLILILVAAELIFASSGCDNISQGLQRSKFEFLYRMNNDVSLLKEYTFGLNKIDDLNFYEKKINNLYVSLNKMETVKGYGESNVLKEKLLDLIDKNLNSVKVLRNKNIPPDQIIKYELEVLTMKEDVSKFMESLNEEIIKVGRE